ncbi:unnamed protein product, partial [Dibothriocephalus latus]
MNGTERGCKYNKVDGHRFLVVMTEFKDAPQCEYLVRTSMPSMESGLFGPPTVAHSLKSSEKDNSDICSNVAGLACERLQPIFICGLHLARFDCAIDYIFINLRYALFVVSNLPQDVDAGDVFLIILNYDYQPNVVSEDLPDGTVLLSVRDPLHLTTVSSASCENSDNSTTLLYNLLPPQQQQQPSPLGSGSPSSGAAVLSNSSASSTSPNLGGGQQQQRYNCQPVLDVLLPPFSRPS